MYKCVKIILENFIIQKNRISSDLVVKVKELQERNKENKIKVTLDDNNIVEDNITVFYFRNVLELKYIIIK